MRSGIHISLGGGRLGIDFQPARHIERRILAVQLHRREHALVIRAEIGLCPYFLYFLPAAANTFYQDTGPQRGVGVGVGVGVRRRRRARGSGHNGDWIFPNSWT